MESVLNYAGDYTKYYSEYSPLFSKNGTMKLNIPMYQTWNVIVPCPDFNIQSEIEEDFFNITTVDGMEYTDGMFLPSEFIDIKIGGHVVKGIQCDIAYVMFFSNGVYYPLYSNNENYINEAIKRDDELYAYLPNNIIKNGTNHLEMVALDKEKI